MIDVVVLLIEAFLCIHGRYLRGHLLLLHLVLGVLRCSPISLFGSLRKI